MKRSTQKLPTCMFPNPALELSFLNGFLRMWCVNNDLIFGSAGMHERRLEKESGLYFNLDYLQELLLTGKFDEAERYLLGFIKVEDNKHSTKIFFEIRKQKYLEALDRYGLSLLFPRLQ